MQRRLIDYLIITLKGIAMGAADAVPGVSGGTIAFISGIYEELITSISNINLSLLKTLKTKGLKPFWKAINGNFLLSLFLGILISFISFMRLAKYLLEQYPVLIWAFFFGLIIASIYFVGKQITNWNTVSIISLVIGTTIAFYISSLPAIASNNNSFYLFFAGAIAICAMILPGISGSFILVILGAYKTLSNAFHDFDIKKIMIFTSGAIVGLLSFSHILKWLFKKYHNATLALLTGFIFGSLNKVWPWKKTLSVMDDKTGTIIPFKSVTEFGTLSVFQQKINDFESYKAITQESISPFSFAELNTTEHQLIFAVILMIAGFLTIFILEKIGAKKMP